MYTRGLDPEKLHEYTEEIDIFILIRNLYREKVEIFFRKSGFDFWGKLFPEFRICDDISSGMHMRDAFLESCNIISYHDIHRTTDRRAITRDIEIEPVGSSLDTRLVLEISCDIVSEM